jgi:hypothetical protein
MANANAAPKLLGSGSLAASASSDSIAIYAPFTIEIAGTWTGTWSVEASTDNNATFQSCVLPDGSPSAFATNGFWDVPNIRVPGVVYRIARSDGTGTLDWRICQ